MDLFHGLYCLSEGKLQVDPVSKAESHDVGIVFLIFERGGPSGELVQIHVKEVHRELTIKVTELIFPVLGLRKVFGKLFKIPFVVGTVIVDAFMDTEMFPFFDRLEGMAAVRALKFKRCSDLFTIDKGLAADLALKLATAASIIVDVFMWCTTERTYGIQGDITGFAFLRLDWFYSLAIAETVVFIPELPVLFDERFDNRQFIGKEFLVFGAVELVMSPLLERNVSADKEDKPTNLFVLFLNDSK